MVAFSMTPKQARRARDKVFPPHQYQLRVMGLEHWEDPSAIWVRTPNDIIPLFMATRYQCHRKHQAKGASLKLFDWIWKRAVADALAAPHYRTIFDYCRMYVVHVDE